MKRCKHCYNDLKRYGNKEYKLCNTCYKQMMKEIEYENRLIMEEMKTSTIEDVEFSSDTYVHVYYITRSFSQCGISKNFDTTEEMQAWFIDVFGLKEWNKHRLKMIFA